MAYFRKENNWGISSKTIHIVLQKTANSNGGAIAAVDDDNEPFVAKLYLAFFGQTIDERRAADAWIQLLNDNALNRVNPNYEEDQPAVIQYILDSFTGAQEFGDLCAGFGIQATK